MLTTVKARESIGSAHIGNMKGLEIEGWAVRYPDHTEADTIHLEFYICNFTFDIERNRIALVFFKDKSKITNVKS